MYPFLALNIMVSKVYFLKFSFSFYMQEFIQGGPEKILLETIDSFVLIVIISVNHPVPYIL